MPIKTYRFLEPRGNSFVYASTTNVANLLIIANSHVTPKNLGVAIYRNTLSRNEPFTLPQPPGCEDKCSIKQVDLAVNVHFSGPLSSKEKLAEMLTDISNGLASGVFDQMFDGFPVNPTDTFTLGTV